MTRRYLARLRAWGGRRSFVDSHEGTSGGSGRRGCPIQLPSLLSDDQAHLRALASSGTGWRIVTVFRVLRETIDPQTGEAPTDRGLEAVLRSVGSGHGGSMRSA